MAGNIGKSKEAAIIAEAKENADSWFTYFSSNNTHFVNQTKFWLTTDSQWNSDQRGMMIDANKIPLVCPKIYGIRRRIVGEQRQATPDLQVKSITEAASPEEIALNEDLVRTISCHSDAKTAYQTSFDHQLFGGYSAIKVISEYERPDKFEKCLKIKAVNEPILCFWDPSAKETSKWDGMFAGEYFGMSRAAFEKEWPDVVVPDSDTLPKSQISLADKDQVYILIYQRKEFKKKKIVQLNNGDVLSEKEYQEALGNYVSNFIMENPGVDEKEIQIPKDFQVAKKRVTSEYKIRTYKIVGNTILENTTWDSKYFSYVFVDGDSHYIDGRQVIRSFFQDAKDLQIFANYLFTQTNHSVKAQRYEGWIGSPANAAGFEKIWNNPGLTQSMLFANPDMDRGGAMPTQIQAPMISPTLIQLRDSNMAEINSTLGIYDSYEGNSQGKPISGVAEENRVRQGNISTFITFSNLNRAIGQVGSVILDAIPKVYDTMRPISLRSRDGSTRNVMLNKPDDGVIQNDTSNKDYLIEIDAGASFEGQRMESLMALKDLLSLSPELANLTADLYAENLSLPNNQVLVKRMRAGFVPPEIVAAGNGEELPPKEPPPPPPEVEFMKADIALREQKQQLDEDRARMELEMKQQQLDFDREKAEANLDIQNQKLMLDKAKLGL